MPTLASSTFPKAPVAARLRPVAAAALVIFALGGCAATPGSDSGERGALVLSDPIEPVNRRIHAFNEGVDKAVLRPVARGYRKVVPDPIKDRVRSLLRNLKSPIVFANDMLQGEVSRGMTTMYRFIANSTFGLGGIHDVAAEMGLEYHDEDFGQTLARAGLAEGPYIVLPILGPSTVRDATGQLIDWFFDPLRLYTATQNPAWQGWAPPTRTGLTVVDTREQLLDPIDEIEKSSIDTYASLRTLYRQKRTASIANQENQGVMAVPQVEGSAFDFPDESTDTAKTPIGQ
jgi:phospholipid-binding lipoprotein MlaA